MIARIWSGDVRVAGAADAERIAHLLHDFNSEFDEPTPGVEFLEGRIGRLVATGDITAVVAGEEPQGVAMLRFAPSLWNNALDCYLEELYVVPDRRRLGIGRALMEVAMDVARRRGATYMHLGTGEGDEAARALYESLGFSSRGGRSEGPVNLFYERDL